jgi:hypothetical protein
MKQIAVALLVLALTLSAAPAAPVTAQGIAPAGPPPLKYIDAQINVMMASLRQYQTWYLNNRGKYFQALTSHSVVPNGLGYADMLAQHPTDQTETLADFWNYAQLPEKVGYSFSVDIYDGPLGRGYVLVVKADVGGTIYTRAENSGPENWRTTEWAPVLGEQ